MPPKLASKLASKMASKAGQASRRNGPVAADPCALQILLFRGHPLTDAIKYLSFWTTANATLHIVLGGFETITAVSDQFVPYICMHMDAHMCARQQYARTCAPFMRG